MHLPRLAASLTVASALVGTALVCAPAQAASDYQIALHRSPAKMAFGHSMRVGGKVTGGPVRGRSVRIYAGLLDESTGGEEHRVGTAKLSPNGYFHFYYRPPSGGDWRLDVRKSAVGSHGEADEESDTTAVYQWADLWNYEDQGTEEGGPDDATTSQGTAEVNGTTYQDATRVNDGSTTNFVTSNHQCKLVRGAAGITSSSPQSVGTLTFSADKYTGIQVHRQQGPASFQVAMSPGSDVSLSAHIGPHADGTDGGTANTVVLLRPQVWCDAPEDAQGSF